MESIREFSEDNYDHVVGDNQEIEPNNDSSEEVSQEVPINEISAEEPFSEESEEVKDKPKPKHRIPAKTRINQIQREKYQALDEANRLRDEAQRLLEENERLKQIADYSSEAAEKHYENGIKLRMDQIKQLKAQAIESGDVQAQIDADEKLASAAAEMYGQNSWKASQAMKMEQQRRAMESVQYQPSGPSPIAHQWVEENASWFHPDSEDYHPDLAAEAESFADRLDAHYYRTGQQHLIQNSEEYFNEINAHLRNFYQQRYMNNQAPKRGLNMKQSRTMVGTVRSGVHQSNGMSGQTVKVTLNPDEKDMARRMGVTDQVFLQKKIEDMRNNPGKRRGY
jgi:hypothetical protein